MIPIRLAIIFCLLTAATSVAVTRYYFPTTQTKTVTVEKEVVKTDVQTITHTVTLPNGSVDTTTTTTDHSQTTLNKDQVAVVKAKNLNVSALVANDFSTSIIRPVYGVSVSKEVLGPVTVGVFGLTSGVVGVSLGLNF